MAFRNDQQNSVLAAGCGTLPALTKALIRPLRDDHEASHRMVCELIDHNSYVP